MTDNNDLVTSDALPLPLKLLTGEQPPSDVLPLALTRLLGTLDASKLVTSDALPLPLTRLISDQPPSDRLPLALNRLMGTLIDVVIPIDPVDPVDPEPPEYADNMPNVSACFNSTITNASNINQCRDWYHNGRDVANDMAVSYSDVVTIAQCYAVRVRAFIALFNDKTLQLGAVWHLLNDKTLNFGASILLINEIKPIVTGSIGYIRCVGVNSAKVAHYQQCDTLPLQSAINYSVSAGHRLYGVGVDKCQSTKIQHAVPVPDRYYPIPEPPPDKPDQVCRIRPPSNALPLRMARKRNGLLSSHLPLSLTCWHDDPPVIIPNLRSYIVHNVITATIGGIAVDILSFGIKTDMDSYCWQGDITITAKDYAKIKAKLDVPRGSEPMINVTVNGFVFAFIAEEQSRSRKFAQSSHSLSGRSITARLGADYAGSQGGLIDQASYVSQIVAQQLNGLPISVLDWDINDWLVPAGAYSVANKTPIAVIQDIAEAGGGFVSSDASQATLSVKPRWPVAAWQLSSATPDVTVPIDVITDISDKRRTSAQYNTVRLNSASEGGEVYRSTQGRDAEAPTQNSDLYTDRDAIVPAGTVVLSDSGIHVDYTLKMLWTEAYNIPLAQLGQIWQVNDTEGAWRGVVKAVSVDVTLANNAPVVTQTVTIDCYLDV